VHRFCEPLQSHGVILRGLQTLKKPHSQSKAEVSFAAGSGLIVSELQTPQAVDKVIPFCVLGVVRFPVGEICEFDIGQFEWRYTGLSEYRAENSHTKSVT
jgi:hypothetical protein